MKIRKFSERRWINGFLLLILILLSLNEIKIQAQEDFCREQKAVWSNFYYFNHPPKLRPSTHKKAVGPSEEIFEPADALIGDSLITGTKISRSPTETIKIYNADGSIWYEFSYNEKSQLYYFNHQNSDLKPYYSMRTRPDLFRIKAVSANWYEVVVNEETQMTKYLSGNDPVLGLDSFENYILQSVHITFDKEKNPGLIHQVVLRHFLQRKE
jgi:hypothetical protein